MKTITTISRTLLVIIIAIISSLSIWAQDTMSSKQNVEKEQYEQILIKEEPYPYFRKEIADSLSNSGYIYYNKGDHKNAVYKFSEAKEIYNIIGDDKMTAEMLSEIGNCFFWQNLYNNAIIFYYKAREKYSSLGDEYYEYFGAAKMLLNIGDSFSYQEEYKKARESYCEAKKLFIIMNEKFIDNYKVENAAALYRILECNEKISKTYYDECDYKNAIEAYKNVINEYQNYYNRFSNNITVEFLAIIGDCYFHQGKYFEAIKSYEDAIEIYLKNEDDEGYMLECAKLYEKIGNCHILNKNYNDAKKVFGDAEEIYKSLDKKDWPEYVSLLEGYARLYYFQDQPSIAYYYIQQALNINDSIVLNELKSLTTTERTSYWEKNSYYYFSSLPNIAIALDNNTVTRDLYNKSALFAKGLLMTSGNEIKRVIYDSGNEDLIKAYNELQDTRARIKALLEKSEDDKKNIIERLEEEAEKQEKDLLEWMVLLNKWDECSDFTENLQLTWKDVQAKLGDNDIAIEFLSFPKLGDENTTMYIALTVRPGYDYPHMIELCEEKDLIAAKENAYTGPELSKLIWKELADAGELKGVDNIYFSPSGLLHTIAIESVPHWSKKGVMMSDTFNIYRLSSTRELALKRKMVDGVKGASVYGGISYNAPVEAMGAPRFGGRETYFAAADLPSPEVMPTQNNQNRAYHVVELEDGTRALQWDSLPGSSEEAIAVTSLLESKTDTHLMTDLVSTEASFKELSGQKRKLIHIATHGFYWSDSTALRHKQMVLMPSNYEKMQEHDKSMVRSGLLFSGAQNTFFHKAIPEGVDDGILTAQEVSYIDLRGLDLVVLSACQTALGEISGEGVFGLQRGFKMAGAQSIIMSLWSVSDKATQDMMTEFYKAYNPDINNKREAFFIAQKFVKEHDSDYTYSNDEDEDQELRNTQPHWAAFILLDALD